MKEERLIFIFLDEPTKLERHGSIYEWDTS